VVVPGAEAVVVTGSIELPIELPAAVVAVAAPVVDVVAGEAAAPGDELDPPPAAWRAQISWTIFWVVKASAVEHSETMQGVATGVIELFLAPHWQA